MYIYNRMQFIRPCDRSNELVDMVFVRVAAKTLDAASCAYVSKTPVYPQIDRGISRRIGHSCSTAVQTGVIPSPWNLRTTPRETEEKS
jgi:hypothetical protein